MGVLGELETGKPSLVCLVTSYYNTFCAPILTANDAVKCILIYCCEYWCQCDVAASGLSHLWPQHSHFYSNEMIGFDLWSSKDQSQGRFDQKATCCVVHLLTVCCVYATQLVLVHSYQQLFFKLNFFFFFFWNTSQKGSWFFSKGQTKLVAVQVFQRCVINWNN